MAIVDTYFGRGVGLGNRLFPWARSRVLAHQHHLQCVAPDWAQLRRGALLKGGIDYYKFIRKIWLFDNFQAGKQEIQGIRKWLLQKFTIAVPELQITPTVLTSPRHRIVFTGETSHFQDLHPYQAIIRQSLFDCVLPKWKDFLEKFTGADIGLNIRLGRDFKQATSPEDFFTTGSLLTPIEWFCQALRLIRTLVGRECATVIISDGTERELRPLLDMGNVTFFQTPAAVTDLFALSKVKVLIGSGGSSFSAWASFLGKVPILAIPGQPFEWFGLGKQHEYLVDVLDIHNPADYIQSSLKTLLT